MRENFSGRAGLKNPRIGWPSCSPVAAGDGEVGEEGKEAETGQQRFLERLQQVLLLSRGGREIGTCTCTPAGRFPRSPSTNVNLPTSGSSERRRKKDSDKKRKKSKKEKKEKREKKDKEGRNVSVDEPICADDYFKKNPGWRKNASLHAHVCESTRRLNGAIPSSDDHVLVLA